MAFVPFRPPGEDIDAYYSSSEGWERKYHLEKLTSRAEPKRAQYRPKLEHLRPFLSSTGRALDFGCGMGAFLDVLQEEGWETYGVEPSPRLRAFAGQRHAMLENTPADGSLDLVVANHVLEHLRDPGAVLRSFAASTRVGGHLFVSVPDLGLLPEHGDVGYVASRQHIASFTSASLEAVLGLAGFAVVFRPDWPVDRERGRLPVLAERVDDQRAPAGTPLAAAEAALRAYAPRAREFERFHRQRERDRRRRSRWTGRWL